MEQQDPDEQKRRVILKREISAKLLSQEEGMSFKKANENNISTPVIPFITSPRTMIPKCIKRKRSATYNINASQPIQRKSNHIKPKRVPSFVHNRKKTESFTDTSESEATTTSFDSFSDTSESECLFSDSEVMNNTTKRKRICYTKPKRQYNDILDIHSLSFSKYEMQDYNGWLQFTLKKLGKSEMNQISIRFAIFLHFYRLDIPILEISKENVGTYQHWYDVNRFLMNDYVSYIKVPLDNNNSFTWWLEPCINSEYPKGENGYAYICHKVHTFSKIAQRSRRQKRKEEKDRLKTELLKGNPIPVLSNLSTRFDKERERAIRSIIHWITSSPNSKTTHMLRTCAAKEIASLAWPKEKIVGLRDKLWSSGATIVIINLTRTTDITLHTHIDYNDIKIDEIIGKGAVGTVYSVQYKRRDLAIKLSKQEVLAFTEGEFRFEVALMCALDHPNILPCYGAGVIAPYYFFLSPLQGRGSLKMLIKDQYEPLSWLKKIYIAKEIAKGLQYLHNKSIIHRDIKSENILIGYNWEVKITDFGTSIFQGKYSKTTKDFMVGTAEWMAPELIEEGKEYNEKVDIFSYGIVLYEIFTRNHPYYEVEHRFNVIGHVLKGNRPLYVNDDIPYSNLRNIMTSCWHTNPKKRPTWQTIITKLEHAEIKAKQSRIEIF